MLPHLMALLTILSLLCYIIFDGCVNGTGIILPFVKKETRHLMLNSITPAWYIGVVWLIYTCTILFSAFPSMYHTILSALYIPIFLMLFCITVRYIALELRVHSLAKKENDLWEGIFAFSSLGVGFFQGAVFGSILSGIKIVNSQSSTNIINCFTPLSLTCGVVIVISYALLGTSWQMYKSSKEYLGSLRSIFHTLLVSITTLFVFMIPTLYFQHPNIITFMLSHKIRLISCIVLNIGNAGIIHLLITQNFKHKILYFVFCIVLIALPLITVLCALYPYAIPFTHTIYSSITNSIQSLKITATITIAMLPMVLGLTSYTSYFFRKNKITNFYSYK